MSAFRRASNGASLSQASAGSCPQGPGPFLPWGTLVLRTGLNEACCPPPALWEEQGEGRGAPLLRQPGPGQTRICIARGGAASRPPSAPRAHLLRWCTRTGAHVCSLTVRE